MAERIANLCCGHAACQNEVRALLEEAWIKGYHRGGADALSHEWGQSPNPYAPDPKGA